MIPMLTAAVLLAAPTAEAGRRDKKPAQPAAPATETLVQVKSASDFATTVANLEVALADRQLTLFGKVDHAAAAKGVDLELPPTTLVIFGNPKVGTRLMQPNPTLGLDLPLKMLVTEAKPGSVTVTYRPIAEVAAAHGVTTRDEVVGKVTGVLAAIAADATR